MENTAKDIKILYFYHVRMSFVAKDIEFISGRYPVKEFRFNTKDKRSIPINLLKQFVFLVMHIRSANLIICFFAGYHSLLPALIGRIFKRPVMIFLGGADVYRYPSFGYGHFNKFLIGKFTCFSARLADLLLPVDECLMHNVSYYYNKDDLQQGIKYFCPELKTPHKTVHLEYDPDLFFRRNSARPRNSFITVAFGIEGASFVRKGIDMIIDVARLLPDCDFVILGCSQDVIKIPFTSNVSFLPPVPYEKLPEVYSAYRFYLQLSIAEGFPSAICEAMLCECVPIGSKVAAIPYIIGDTGFILDKRNVMDLMDIIQSALSVDDLDSYGRKARERISRLFYPGSRREKIIEIIDGFVIS